MPEASRRTISHHWIPSKIHAATQAESPKLTFDTVQTASAQLPARISKPHACSQFWVSGLSGHVPR
jgi:hypothetical protein